MGGAVSAGEDNEELVDNLVESDYLKSPSVERALRAVDRGCYYLEDHRDTAYKDLAWKHGKLHISAPCIYSEVLECLDVHPGMSFLNLGSGTGYLSTVVGLLLGANGLNHGVEVHESVVEYSRKKLEEFVRECPAVDMMDFTPPQFVVGNCLQLDPSVSFGSYDRVYCGAAVPEDDHTFFRSFIKIGGVAVMPCGDQLQKVRRVGENEWETKSVLPVSFATMLLPSAKEKAQGDVLQLPDREPQSLQNLCRVMIRKRVRDLTLEECPEAHLKSILEKKTSKVSTSDHQKKQAGRRRRRIRRIVIPVFNTDSEDEEGGEDDLRRNVRRHIVAIRTSGPARGPTGRIQFEDLHFTQHPPPLEGDNNGEDSVEEEEEEMKGCLAAEAPETEDMPSQEEEGASEMEEGLLAASVSSPITSQILSQHHTPALHQQSQKGTENCSQALSDGSPGVTEREAQNDTPPPPPPGDSVRKWETGADGNMSDDEDSDGHNPEYKQIKEERKAERAGVLAIHKDFSLRIKHKIQLLPLPQKLKHFLNFHR